MSYWLLIPFLGIVAIIQVAWLPLIPVFGFKIDLALVVVATWGLLGPVGQAAEWGLIVGLVLDLTSGLPFGIYTLTLTAIGLLVGLGQRTFFHGNLIAPPATIILATLFHSVLILAILTLFNWQIPWSDYLLRVTLPVAILNVVATPLVYFPLLILARRLYPQLEF